MATVKEMLVLLGRFPLEPLQEKRIRGWLDKTIDPPFLGAVPNTLLADILLTMALDIEWDDRRGIILYEAGERLREA